MNGGLTWEEHAMTMGSTHSVDMKYIGSNLGSANSPRRVAKMIKSFARLMNYDQ
jgi:hypothetical protein